MRGENNFSCVQAELKVEWGREKYTNYMDGEEMGPLPGCVWGDGWSII